MANKSLWIYDYSVEYWDSFDEITRKCTGAVLATDPRDAYNKIEKHYLNISDGEEFNSISITARINGECDSFVIEISDSGKEI